MFAFLRLILLSLVPALPSLLRDRILISNIIEREERSRTRNPLLGRLVAIATAISSSLCGTRSQIVGESSSTAFSRC